MAFLTMLASAIALFTLHHSLLVDAGSLADIEHVVLFMQENRAFDHYFGTLAGVRGFSDPNVQVNDGLSVWHQDVNSELTKDADYLLPFYLNYQGGHFLNATMCMDAGSNGWQENQEALNQGLNDHWATNNTPWSWGHYRRSDIPVQFAIADAWTIGDMYQESVIASTNPNRVTWVSGSINVPGNAQTADEGGLYIDNNEVPGCEAPGLNCYPLKWKTTPEYYEDAGVTWQVYQDVDNFDDNPLAWFNQYQTAKNGSTLSDRGMAFLGLDKFYAQANAGTLPQVSYVIGPTELSEHPPYSPRDGAWLQKQVIDAVTGGKAYDKTALIISYDETGGWGDHVTPYHSPQGTDGEWINDPYGDVGYTYSGPGFRLPFYIVSPWTRGGAVFTEHCDHNSQIMFVEKWLATKGKNVTSPQVAAWRREHMSDLTNAFNFDAPDTSLPNLPYAPPPHKNAKGVWDGSSHCEATYSVLQPTVPYGKQNSDVSSLSEKGFKSVRGALTEGRYLTIEMNGYALTNPAGKATSKKLTSSKATADHADKSQQWIVHQLAQDGNTFIVGTALDSLYMGNETNLWNNSGIAMPYQIEFQGGSQGYAFMQQNGKYLQLDSKGHVSVTSKKSGFNLFSVT